MGNELPASVSAYYEALDSGSFDAAAACFSDDVIYAVPRAGAQEGDLLNVINGRSDLISYFAHRGSQPYSHRILFCATDGDSCLVEGVSVESGSGRTPRTFVASLQLDTNGLMNRYLAHQCEPAVVPGPTFGLERPTEAATLVDRYLDALRNDRFEDAAACFSQEVLYSGPPYRNSGATDNRRIEVKGRRALLEALVGRGTTRHLYRVDVLLQRGPSAVFEAAMIDLRAGREGTMVASLSLDGKGLVDRYVAFHTAPAVPRR